MSYCTIEEAWGLSEPFVDEPPTSKRRHKKKHKSPERGKKREHLHRPTNHQDHAPPTSSKPHPKDIRAEHADLEDEPYDRVEESFINSPSNISYTPSFSRSFEPERVPDAVDVSMDGVPFESIGDDENEHSPDASSYSNMYEPQVAESKVSISSNQLMPIHREPRRVVVHEELEWMRNNMSHINDKIDRLTTSLEARQQQTVHTYSTTHAHDTLVFVLVGVFALVLVDIFFRAGRRLL
jgi:hypothetical protein